MCTAYLLKQQKIFLKPAEQRQTLLNLLGLDFTTDDETRARLYTERTDVGRAVVSVLRQVVYLKSMKISVVIPVHNGGKWPDGGCRALA